MNAEEYLNQFKAALKDFSPEEQAALTAEIADHIASCQEEEDPSGAPAERERRLGEELGSAQELARNFKRVHRPNRLLDYLLVALPTLLVIPLLPLLTMLIVGTWDGNWYPEHPFLWTSIRIAIIFHALMLVASLLRRSTGVLLFWLPQASLIILTLFVREGWFGGLLNGWEGIFWLAAQIALLFWLARVVWLQRGDAQMVILAVLPFLFTAANMSAGLVQASAAQIEAERPNFVLGWFGLHQVASLLWPALFYLPRRRAVAWLGLLVYALPYFLYNVYPYRAFPIPLAAHTLPMLLVLAGWGLESVKQVRLSRQG